MRLATGGHPIFTNNAFENNPEYSLNLDFAGFPLLAGSNVFTNTVGNAVWSDGGTITQDAIMYGSLYIALAVLDRLTAVSHLPFSRQQS